MRRGFSTLIMFQGFLRGRLHGFNMVDSTGTFGPRSDPMGTSDPPRGSRSPDRSYHGSLASSQHPTQICRSIYAVAAPRPNLASGQVVPRPLRTTTSSDTFILYASSRRTTCMTSRRRSPTTRGQARRERCLDSTREEDPAGPDGNPSQTTTT